jgi:putative ubiquitin-RnfH superfamily antitoxin RatB of RatAB toxin-antitoxin module
VPDSADQSIRVSVAYVGPQGAWLKPLELPPGTALGQAIERSGLLVLCPEIDLGSFKVGIFGKLAPLGQTLEDGDRVEIYRPLIADPKESRKRRAEEGKPLRKGGARPGAVDRH